MGRSNSCSERRAALIAAAAVAGALALAPRPAGALNVHAVYRTACTRDLGVILKVEKRNIHLLTLDGNIIQVPRHEIVSLAYYPVSQLPIARLPDKPSVPALDVKTLYRGDVVDLAIGWPVDYSDTKIAFLLDNGNDMVVDKDSIWSLDFLDQLSARAPARAPEPIEFAHPQTAGFCGDTTAPKDGATARRVFAQQILNDRVVIKRELDRLSQGYEEVVEFVQDQKFYPVPHVYKDRTALGLWVSVLARYGASKNRTNNFTPMLVDELHLGPFRYQHIFLSGAAPNQMLLHDEVQSQIYYRFKAAYFHASVFADPNLVLVGTKYDWEPADLEDEQLDDRINEIIAIEFGFDFGPVSIELSPAVAGQAAVKTPEYFESTTELNLWRAGLRFTRRLWEAQLFAGYAATEGFVFDEATMFQGDSDWQYLYGRANVSFEPYPRVGALASLIYRRLDHEVQGFSPAGSFDYESTSISGGVQGWYALSHRLDVGGSASLELHSREFSGDTDRRRRYLPKLGVFTSFSF